MSFSHNPYEHFELIHHDDDKWGWYCHGCGGEQKSHLSLEFATTMWASFKRHLWSSHRRMPEDFEDWSKY